MTVPVPPTCCSSSARLWAVSTRDATAVPMARIASRLLPMLRSLIRGPVHTLSEHPSALHVTSLKLTTRRQQWLALKGCCASICTFISGALFEQDRSRVTFQCVCNSTTLLKHHSELSSLMRQSHDPDGGLERVSVRMAQPRQARDLAQRKSAWHLAPYEHALGRQFCTNIGRCR